MTEERREVTLGELEKLQRAGNVDMSMVQAKGVCTIFREDGSIKGKMDIMSVEDAKEIEKAKAAIAAP